MPEWRVTIDTEPSDELGADELERFAMAVERDFGRFGPACGLHSGALSLTVTVDAESYVGAIAEAALAMSATVLATGLKVPPTAHVEVDALAEERAVA